MNKSGVLTTKEEKARIVGFDYHRVQEECVFVGRLDSRNWYNYRDVYALICNFTTADNRKFSMFAFRHKGDNEIYAPRDCDIDFAHDVKEGSIWKCVVSITKFGKLYWKSATLVQPYSSNDDLLSYTSVKTLSSEEINANIEAREAKKRMKAAEERRNEEEHERRREERERNSDTWYGRRVRFIEKYEKGEVTPEDMHMQAWEGDFVISPDHTTIYCPISEFKTRKLKAGFMITFPESCKSCKLKGCKGTYQKQFQMSTKFCSSSSGYHHYDDPNNPFYKRH